MNDTVTVYLIPTVSGYPAITFTINPGAALLALMLTVMCAPLVWEWLGSLEKR